MKTILAALVLSFSLPILNGCGIASNESNSILVLTPKSAAVSSGGTVQFTARSNESQPIQWFVNGILNGNSNVGTINSSGNYSAPARTASMTIVVTATTNLRHPTMDTATVHVVAPGQISATGHPQVAGYTISPPDFVKVFVEFGPDTTYGLKTSGQTPTAQGGPVSILVAGMRAFTQYHMRAVVEFSDGSRLEDLDQVFTTGGLQGVDLPGVAAQTMPGMKPQPGIEMINGVNSQAVPAYATDLQGNIIWWYKFADGTTADLVNPIQPLPNGHFLVTVGPTWNAALLPPQPVGTIDVVREIDLAGNTVRQLSVDDLNARLAAAGFSLTVSTFHHEVLPLPSGHWLVVANHVRQYSLPGTVDVLGDDIIDVNESLQPVWTWSAFDHLDVNRQPMFFPDWTHTNALTWLPADGNLLVSMRNQHWIIKIDYNNGKGTGDVLWRLGQGGDFTLLGGTDPTDWFYGQHGPNIDQTISPGVFSVAVMDDGLNRMSLPGQTCPSSGAPTCPYSSGNVYRLDENAKTATLIFHYVPPQFSPFGGYAKLLDNGNLEFDFCAALTSPPGAIVYEVTPDADPKVVWQISIGNQNAYRAVRLPSLYPGVQW